MRTQGSNERIMKSIKTCEWCTYEVEVTFYAVRQEIKLARNLAEDRSGCWVELSVCLPLVKIVKHRIGRFPHSLIKVDYGLQSRATDL